MSKAYVVEMWRFVCENDDCAEYIEDEPMNPEHFSRKAGFNRLTEKATSEGWVCVPPLMLWFCPQCVVNALRAVHLSGLEAALSVVCDGCDAPETVWFACSKGETVFDVLNSTRKEAILKALPEGWSYVGSVIKCGSCRPMPYTLHCCECPSKVDVFFMPRLGHTPETLIVDSKLGGAFAEKVTEAGWSYDGTKFICGRHEE